MLASVVSIPLIAMLFLILLGCLISACERRRRLPFTGQNTEALRQDNDTLTESTSSDKLLL